MCLWGLLTSKRPARPGVYERTSLHGTTIYSYWTGKYWCCGFDTSELAGKCTWQRSIYPLRPWRGLAKEPGK
jgi:hypothetical protein